MPFPYSEAIVTYVDDVAPGSFTTPADLAAKMQACVLDTWDIAMVATLVSDVTTVTPTGAQRQLKFALGQEFNSTLQPIPPPGVCDPANGEGGNAEAGSSLTIGTPPFTTIAAAAARSSGRRNRVTRCGNPCKIPCAICGTAPCPGPNQPNPPLASASGIFQDLFTITLRKCLSSSTLHQLPPILN